MKKRLDLYIGGFLADLSDDSFILLNFAASDADNPAALKNTYSAQVTLPATPANDRIFGAFREADRLTAAGAFNPLARTGFILVADGELIMEGYCRLDSAKPESYEVSLFGGLGSFIYALTYGETGKALTLADLDYLGGGDNELDFVITAPVVRSAWTRLDAASPGLVEQKWDVVNFAPMYNGVPKADFAADKALVPVGSAGITAPAGYAGKDGYALVSFPRDCDEWEVRDLRSYLQRPVFSIAAFLKALTNPNNTGGYAVDISQVTANFEAAHCWMTLPILTSITRKDIAALDVTEQETGGADTAVTRIEFNEPLDAAGTVTATVNVRPRLTGIDAGAPAKLSLSQSRQAGTKTLRTETLIFCQLLAYDSDGNVVGGSFVKCLRGEVQIDAIQDIGGVALAAGYTPKWNGGWVQVLCGADAFEKESSGVYALAAEFDLAVEASGVSYLAVEMTPVEVYQEREAGQMPLFPDYSYGAAANHLFDGDDTYTFAGKRIPLGTPGTYSYAAAASLRSGSAVSKADLLGGTPSPASVLVSLCKLLGWKLHFDDIRRRVTVLPRDAYYDGETINLQKNIERDGGPEIIPNTIGVKWLDYALEGVGGAFQERYKKIYGREYGSFRLDTGYSFTDERSAPLDGSAFRSAAAVLHRGPYFYAYDKGATRYPSPFIDSGNRYTLWSTGTGEGNDYAIPSLGSSAVATPLPLDEMRAEGYDAFYRVEMSNDKGEGVSDGSGVLLYLEGWNSTLGALSDDIAAMGAALGGNTACWIPYLGTAKIDTPSFLPYIFLRSWGGAVQRSLDIGQPRELGMPEMAYEQGATLFERYWERYLADRLHVDAKICRCKVHWKGRQVTSELLRHFYWFDNCLWVIDKITNYTPVGDEPCEVDFVRVIDSDAYTAGWVPPSYLRVNPTVLNYPAEGSALTIDIEASGSWSLSGVPNWIVPSALSGTGDATVTLTAASNAGTARLATITVSADDTPTTVTVGVSQAAATEWYLNVSPLSIPNVPSAGGVYTLNIETNDSWNISAAAGVGVSPSSGSGNATVSLTIHANTGDSARTLQVWVWGGHPPASQSPAKVYIYQVAPAQPYLTIDPSSGSWDAAGGTLAVDITASGSWTISGLPAWLTASKLSGTGDDTVTFAASANAGAARSATVTFTQDALTATFTASQDAADYLDVQPRTLSFTAAGGSQSLTVTSNVGWLVADLPSWLTANVLGGLDDGTVVITAAANAGAARNATVTIKDANDELSPVAISVTQAAVVASLDAQPRSLAFDGAGNTLTLVITANIAWTLTLPAWITADISSGSGNATVSLTADPNGNIARSGSVVVASAVPDLAESITVAVSQGTGYITFDPQPLVFDPAGGTLPVMVTASAWWSIINLANKPAWITNLTGSSGPAGTYRIDFTVAANGTAQTRTWTPVFRLTEFPTVANGLNIAQTAVGYLTADPLLIDYIAAGDTEQITVDSNRQWRVTSSPAWITLDKTSGSGIGEEHINATASANAGAARTGSIVVESVDGTLSATITVRQASAAIKALRFTAISTATLSVQRNGSNAASFEYSTDGTTWAALTSQTLNIAAGESIYVRGMNTGGISSSTSNYAQFVMTGSLACSGNVMHLIDYTQDLLTIPGTYCFYRLFYDCASLATAPELPATTLRNYCYSHMFYDCSSLTTAPELPATTLASSCYRDMFYGCSSLATAPELPATTLASNCYEEMFRWCTSLSYIKAMFTTDPGLVSTASYTRYWVEGVASSGTFVKNRAATWNRTGPQAVPSGWTIEYEDN